MTGGGIYFTADSLPNAATADTPVFLMMDPFNKGGQTKWSGKDDAMAMLKTSTNFTHTHSQYSTTNHTHSIYSTTAHTHSNYVPTSRTINSKALSSNISLVGTDLGMVHSTNSVNSSTAISANVWTTLRYYPVNSTMTCLVCCGYSTSAASDNKYIALELGTQLQASGSPIVAQSTVRGYRVAGGGLATCRVLTVSPGNIYLRAYSQDNVGVSMSYLTVTKLW